MIAVAAVAWLGLGLQCYLALQARMSVGHSLGSALIWFFSFFTVLTNLAIAKSLTLLLSGSHARLVRWVAQPSTQSGLATAIAMVGITYEVLLRRLWKPAGLP
jgi:hypothetical protein